MDLVGFVLVILQTHRQAPWYICWKSTARLARHARLDLLDWLDRSRFGLVRNRSDFDASGSVPAGKCQRKGKRNYAVYSVPQVTTITWKIVPPKREDVLRASSAVLISAK